MAELINLASVAHPVSGSTWCARAWVRGTTTDCELRLTTVGTNIKQSAFTPVTNKDWARVPDGVQFSVIIQPTDTELDLSVLIPYPRQGDYLLIDDVELWQSSSGQCDERG
jgi:hypothetical protein